LVQKILKAILAYDAVIASEVIEHVSDVEMFLDCCVKACKKDGSLFFTTINKTTLSNIFAIWLAEVNSV
jgi:polyprenyldihydroxybenzoate methyltransferase / 3-demethylubiquinol 3-O-methyltransferase